MSREVLRQLLFSLLLLLVSCSFSFSQNSLKAEIQVMDKRAKPIAGIEVLVREQSTTETRKAFTNTDGKVSFELTSGNRWNIYIAGYLQQPDYLEVPQDGYGEQSLYFTFDPALDKRLKQQVFDRKGLQEVKVKSNDVPASPAKGFFVLELTVANSAKEIQANKRVALVSIAQRKMYTLQTNVNGMARFHLPINSQYDIDVEEQLNTSHVDASAKENVIAMMTVVHDSYNINETRSNDTIIQKIKQPVEGKNSKAIFRVKMKRSNGKVFNENVFLDEIHGSTVYKAITDQNGEAFFILPFGKKFMVHFNYQRDIDVIDFTDARGSADGFLEITYKPNPALEHPERFIPKVGELVLVDFEHYHKQPYPKPNDANKPNIIIRSLKDGIFNNKKESVVEIGISSMFMQSKNRKPINVSFVMDRSGSMAGYDRIESLKEGFAQLVQKLGADDFVSIVLFDDEMELLLPAQRIGYDKEKIIALINSIQPRGGTNMLKAMKIGYEQVMLNYQKGAVNSIVLLTDGYDTNPVQVLTNAQQPYNGKVTCMGIGVGRDYNYDLVNQLVTKSGGLMDFAGEGKELVSLFSQKLLGIIAPVAKNVRLLITYATPIQLKKVYGGSLVSSNNQMATIKLPDLYSGMEKPLLAVFSGNAGKGSVGVTLQYTDPSTGKEAAILLSAALQDEIPRTRPIEEEQRKMYAVAFANECLTKMAAAFEKGNIALAKQYLLAGLEKLKELYPAINDKDIKELLAKMERYKTAFNNIDNKKKLEK